MSFNNINMKSFFISVLLLSGFIGFSQSYMVWGWEMNKKYDYEEVEDNISYNAEISSSKRDFEYDGEFKYKTENGFEFELEFDDDTYILQSIRIINISSSQIASSMFYAATNQFGIPDYGYELKKEMIPDNPIIPGRITYEKNYYFNTGDEIVLFMFYGYSVYYDLYHSITNFNINEWNSFSNNSPANDPHIKSETSHINGCKWVRTLLKYWPK